LLTKSSLDALVPLATVTAPPAPRRKPFCANLWVQVFVAITLAVPLGHLSPAKAIAMKPLGDAFIRLQCSGQILDCTTFSVVAEISQSRKLSQLPLISQTLSLVKGTKPIH
jgi:aerobic C4-dicarboxylate transport protein